MGKVAANKAEGVKTSQRSSEKGKRRFQTTFLAAGGSLSLFHPAALL